MTYMEMLEAKRVLKAAGFDVTVENASSTFDIGLTVTHTQRKGVKHIRSFTEAEAIADAS